MSLAGLNQARVAMILTGAVKSEWNRLGIDIHVRFWDALLDRYLGVVKKGMGQDEAEAALTEGADLSFDDAVKLALTSV
jgi:hypothetical protein